MLRRKLETVRLENRFWCSKSSREKTSKYPCLGRRISCWNVHRLDVNVRCGRAGAVQARPRVRQETIRTTEAGRETMQVSDRVNTQDGTVGRVG